MKRGWIVWNLLIVLAILAAVMLERVSSPTGTDDLAQMVILRIDPGYQPWVAPFYEPDEIPERLLFLLQAVCGGGLLGYCLYRLRGQRARKASDEPGIF